MADFRSMLDELMGKDRNLLPHEKNRSRRHFSDRDICKNFLAKMCFTELFQKTKMDLGPCPLVHDDQMKEMWEACPDKDRYSYERDFVAECNRMIADCDSRTRRLKAKYREDSIIQVKEQLQESVRKMEEYGEIGKIEESVAMNMRKEKLEEQLEKLLAGTDDVLLMIPGTQKNVVPCDICGAAVVGDQINHAEGKQHIGFEVIRQAKKEVEDMLAARSGGGGISSSSSSKGNTSALELQKRMLDKERKEQLSSSQDRDRDRDRDRERDRDRDRQRERDWDRDRDRNRDREREHRDRSPRRDRGQGEPRDREREWERNRDKDRDRERDRGRDWERDRGRERPWENGSDRNKRARY